MSTSRRIPPLRSLLAWAAVAVVLAAIGVFLFAWSGLYSVAASSGHFALTRWLLTFGLHSSARTHSVGVKAPPLDDPDLVRLGAGHYAGGCAPCHGAPGTPINRITAQMLPPPPNLISASSAWDAEELFWLVKHGIKYTGMPAWPALQREDEVWAVVAFLERLPELSPEEYRDLANFPAAVGTSAQPTERSTFSEMLTVCARCHGDADSPPTSRLAPRLSGQSMSYMATALRSYAKGARRSGIMEPVAAELEEGTIDAMAAYYAVLSQGPATTSAQPPDPEAVARGRAIAREGAPDHDIPSCLSCHGQPQSEVFPRLEGQHEPYLVSQLRAFRSGIRGRTTTGDVMETIARRLSDQQIRDVAAYFASVETDMLGGQANETAADEP